MPINFLGTAFGFLNKVKEGLSGAATLLKTPEQLREEKERAFRDEAQLRQDVKNRQQKVMDLMRRLRVAEQQRDTLGAQKLEREVRHARTELDAAQQKLRNAGPKAAAAPRSDAKVPQRSEQSVASLQEQIAGLEARLAQTDDAQGSTRIHLASQIEALQEALARAMAAGAPKAEAPAQAEPPRAPQGLTAEDRIFQLQQHIIDLEARLLRGVREGQPPESLTHVESQLAALQEALERLQSGDSQAGQGAATSFEEADPKAQVELESQIADLEARLAAAREAGAPPETLNLLESQLGALQEALAREPALPSEIQLVVPEVIDDAAINDPRVKELLRERYFGDSQSFGPTRPKEATALPVEVPPHAAANLAEEVLASFFGLSWKDAEAALRQPEAPWTQLATNHLIESGGDADAARHAFERAMLRTEPAVYPVLKDLRALLDHAKDAGTLSREDHEKAGEFMRKMGVPDLLSWLRGVVDRHPAVGKRQAVGALFIEAMRYVQQQAARAAAG